MPPPKISIVVAFKNRELDRVKKSLDSVAQQSFKDFELIFIDYGSEEEVASQTEQLVANYHFCNYCYIDTRGWFWNRSDALNTGIKKARGHTLVIYDIDLVIEPEFLLKLSTFSYDNQFYTFSCFYLPEHFNLNGKDLTKDGIHYEQNYVGLCAVKREAVSAVGYFDEYFMVWGAEDDDLYQRLICTGLHRKQMEAYEYLVFHQWHAKESPVKPSLWYLTMVNHLYTKKLKEPQTEIALNKERPVLKPVSDKIYIDATRLEFLRDQNFLFFNSFIDGFMRLISGEMAYAEYELLPEKKSSPGLMEVFRKRSIKKLQFDLKDITSFLEYFVGINRQYLSDYYLKNDGGKVLFVCIKK